MITFIIPTITLLIGFVAAWIFKTLKGKQIPEELILCKERYESASKNLLEKNERILTLQNSLTESQGKAIRFQASYEQQNLEVQTIRNKCNELENSALESNRRIVELSTANQNLDCINSERLLEVNQLRIDTDELRHVLQTTANDLLQKEYEANDFKRSSNKLSEIVSQREVEIDTLKKNNERLSNELIDAKTNLNVVTESRNSLVQQLQAKGIELNAKSYLLINTQEELSNMRVELATKIAQIDTHNKVCEEHNKVCEEYEQGLKEIKEQIEEIRLDNQSKQNEINSLSRQLSTESGQLKVLRENADKLDEQIRQLNEVQLTQFKNIANEILEAKTQTFTELNHTKMSEVLNQFRENVDGLKKKVEDTYGNESRERSILEHTMKELVTINVKLNKEAQNLANALKHDSQQQGSWGERTLETILQQAGFIKGVNYFFQENIKGEGNQDLRPDFIIQLPEERKIVIDSKVSLTAFTNYVNANCEEDKVRYINEHIDSKRRHIRDLSSKKYSEHAGALEYVLMFVPLETAFLEALEHEPKLWKDAYDRKIIIVSPTNLIAVLKIVEQMWNVEKQTKNSKEIAEQAGRIHDKYMCFIENFEKIGRALQTATTAFRDGKGQLINGDGNLSKQINRLIELGVQTNKDTSKIPADYLKSA